MSQSGLGKMRNVFESDVSLKAFVLNNDEPGKNEPFYVTEDDLDQE